MHVPDPQPRLMSPSGGFPHLSRRGLLAGAATVGLSGSLAGCSTLSAGLAGGEVAPGTVQFWNLFGGGDGARLQGMLDVYRKAHGPNSLEAATFSWGNPYYTKVTLATLGGHPSDVAISHATRAVNLARGGLLEPITDDMLALAGLKPTDFSEIPWKAGQVDGQQYTIPLDTHPFVLYYNVDVCQKAGLMDGDKLKPIVGLDQWEAALTAAKKVTGQFGCAVPTIGDTASCWRWLTTLYHQQEGATPFLSDGGRDLSWNEDLALKTLTLMQKWTKAGLMPKNTDYPGAQTLMFTGKAGFYLMGVWEITTAQSIKGLKFGMTAIPTLFDKAATQGDSHTFVLPRMNRDEAQLKRAMGFVKAMLDQSIAWAKGGHVPAYVPAVQSKEFTSLEPQKNYADVVKTVTYDAQAWYSGSGSTFENIIGAQIGLVEQGLTSPQRALDSARSQLSTYAKTADPLG